jgi:hypothetical protein
VNQNYLEWFASEYGAEIQKVEIDRRRFWTNNIVDVYGSHRDPWDLACTEVREEQVITFKICESELAHIVRELKNIKDHEDARKTVGMVNQAWYEYMSVYLLTRINS